MRLSRRACFIFLFLLSPVCLQAQKADLSRSILEKEERYWDAARKIWTWAETGYQEVRSSALLASLLEDAGFAVERSVAEIPTALMASYGRGRPVIGILGEYDALPGLAQEAVPTRRPIPGQAYGHACGHHLFGVASAAAAIALADEIRKGNLAGTIRFYGTPAEEGGSAKVFMVRAGLFQDVDAVLHWHPDDGNSAGARSNLARIAVKFRFKGESAHAAGAPEEGRSALDAVELTNHAAQLLREHTPDFTRIHHVVTAGGGAPNVVPSFAEVFYYVRHPDAAVVKDLYRRLLLCARAGALATETELEVEYLGGTYNLLPNDALAEVALRNLRELNDLGYNAAERAFAEALGSTLERPLPLASLREVKDTSGEISRGSTDVGDVSWNVPTAGLRVATWVPGTPAHSWQAVASGGTSIGRRGMLLAARVLAAAAWDLFRSPETLERARREQEGRLSEQGYESMIDADQKPPLDYRKRPSR